MGGRTRRHERSRAHRGAKGSLEDMEGQHVLSNQPVTLSSLGPFKYSVKQGERKRKNKSNNFDDTESGSEIGLELHAPSESSEETFTEENSTKDGNLTGTVHELKDDEDINTDTTRLNKGKTFAGDPDETPTQANFPFFRLPQQHHRQQQSTPRTPSSFEYPSPTPIAPHFVPASQPPLRRSFSVDSETGSTQSPPVQGLNDYNILRNSPEKDAELKRLMDTLGDVFDVEEWDPELPTLADPDASPERLTLKPEPLTYTTVGSVARPTGTRQFTAPNRIQREGRAGLEVAGRRPMLPPPPSSSRGQDFFPTRNAAQYNTGQTYSQAAAESYAPEQSPVGHYQSSQHGRHSFTQDQSPMGNYTSSQAGGQNFANDPSSTANHAMPQAGARNFMQEQVFRQESTQEQSLTDSTNRYQLQQLRKSPAEQSAGAHTLTVVEEDVFKSLGLPLPMTSSTSRPENPVSNAGRSYQSELSPQQEALLAQLQTAKPQERFVNMPHLSTGKAPASVPTSQRPTHAMNHDTSMSISSTNSAARLQDAKMSTVQRLAQFPNPDQERAKARLAELAASKMRANEENQRPGRFSQSRDSDQEQTIRSGSDATVQIRRGGASETNVSYLSNLVEGELNHSFRFPNSSTNPLQQNYTSVGSNLRANPIPGKTPQGYPQPLTAGPPGQRQNTAPSSNKALNSMQQQMLANGNQRASGTNHQYAQPRQFIKSPPDQPSLSSRPADSQRPTFEPSTTPRPVPDLATYPWAQLDKEPNGDFTDGAPPRIRETLGYGRIGEYYPNGMDMDTIRSHITTLPLEEALKFYPGGMDESTKKWYEAEQKWQRQPVSDLGLLLNESVPLQQWKKSSSTFRRDNNFNGDPTDFWFHSGSRKLNSRDERNSSETSTGFTGPGIIGQPRRNGSYNGGQSVDHKSLTTAEIKAIPLPLASEALLGNVFDTLRSYCDKEPGNVAKLRARGFVDAPHHAIDAGPNGNDSFFGPISGHRRDYGDRSSTDTRGNF